MLAEHEAEIRLVAAATLAAIALHGLVTLRRARAEAAGIEPSAGRPAAHYVRFFAITSANPLTIASFAAVAASLPLGTRARRSRSRPASAAASAGWHLVLTAAAGHAGRWITPRIQRGLAIGGRVAVLLIAAHLALGA